MNDLIRYGVTKRWSDAVVVGGLGYFVEVPDHPEGSPRDQIEETFRQVEARLQQIGSDLTRLVQVLVYLPYPEDLALFNELWDAWIPMGYAPVSSLHAPSACSTRLPSGIGHYRSDLVSNDCPQSFLPSNFLKSKEMQLKRLMP